MFVYLCHHATWVYWMYKVIIWRVTKSLIHVFFSQVMSYMQVWPQTWWDEISPSLGVWGNGLPSAPNSTTHAGSMVCMATDLSMNPSTNTDCNLFRTTVTDYFCKIKTLHSSTFCLPEPKFVGSFWVPESENPDDDKVFFFFRETAVEAQGLGKSTYSRIGQLCRVRHCFGSWVWCLK